MKFKVVPPVRGLETLRTVASALPLVPDDEESCCVRIVRETDIPSPDEAREWLTFCRALGLAETADTGYRRVRGDPTQDVLADRFHDRVYGADSVLGILAGEDAPLSVSDLSDRFEVPAWERHRHTDPDQVWRDRIERILGWAVLFGLAEQSDSGYRR